MGYVKVVHFWDSLSEIMHGKIPDFLVLYRRSQVPNVRV